MNDRRPYVAGNWKMNLLRDDAHELALGVGMLADRWHDLDIGIFPGHLVIGEIVRGTAGGPLIVGAQNCHFLASGAATGEVSPEQLQEIGATAVLIGHSERREFAGEDLELLEKKMKAAIVHDLNVIYCVGETGEEREAGQAEAKVAESLAILKEIGEEDRARIDIAYEPIWAIGTGVSAQPSDAGAMHAFIRGQLDEIGGFDGARILYGGSVKPGNAEELFAQASIDGFLVGGASLKVESFIGIIEAMSGIKSEDEE